ncbi:MULTISPECIES: hypothetical protein [unclassified Crossiella]|uniref:preprotein translocase subunit SecA n=1 Tax=unclassified Crossiella TaxID=2620835 RepID=UPI001FFE7681|nr:MULTISPECIES: hypothetical protein [unclassified Crossiella]MCK2240902.1 hypothetical protein [Crossiella sp. S99.2]MCK2253954.1 hypothetical protein [Crossiella sp. S99.1]
MTVHNRQKSPFSAHSNRRTPHPIRSLGAALDRRIPYHLRALARQAYTQSHTLHDLPDEVLAERYQEIRRHRPRSRSWRRHIGTQRAVFAMTAQTIRRSLGVQLHPEQFLGAAALAYGYAAEMRTGEGKTLTVALAAAYHALPGAGVHVMTANDYLANRDAGQLAPLFATLGLTTAAITATTAAHHRRTAYRADITYGTVSEFGFDHLRDNMVTAARDRLQRRPHVALLDEADAVLIDDADTPLIITGDPEPASHNWPTLIAPLIPTLQPVRHYDGLLADRQLDFTDDGWATLHRALDLDDRSWRDPEFLAAAQNALRAELLHQNERDYLVVDDRVVLLDPHTGRALPDRRLSDGLHQALEAKEGLPVRAEPRTLAAISIQRYLRRYTLIGGLSGTLRREAAELHRIYRLPVLCIPTHTPSARTDLPDQLYASHTGRTTALVERIADAHRVGRPVLVGIATIQDCEALSRNLDQLGIPHAVLTARDNAHEAAVIAGAGRLGAVTIATAVAGRGTDIRLGGDPPEDLDKVRALGGLLVLSGGRGSTRRTDDQLAGRAARQGDPGTTQFLLSAEDDLLLDNATEAMRALEPELATTGGEPITGPHVQRLVEKAQALADTRRYLSRKHLLRYDEIIGHQQDALHHQRNEILATPLPVLLHHFANAAATTLWLDDENALAARLVAILPDKWPSSSRLNPDGLAVAVHDLLLAATSDQPPEHACKRILTALDHASAQLLDTLLTLREASHTATWTRTDPVEEFRHLAVRAYRAARHTFQLGLLRELLFDSPQWALPTKPASPRYLP